jgi:hypothetical protein
VLAACGARLGAVNDLNEHGGVREKVVKPYLRRISADEMGQHPLPCYADIKPDPRWRDRVLKHLDGADCYKGAKMALIWPLWVEHFPEARWIIVRREPNDIAASCLRTSFMRAYKTHQEWVRWAQEYHDRCDALMQAVGDKAMNVYPHDAVKGDTEAYRAAVEHAGLSWRPDAVKAVIRPGKWHA